MRRFTRALGTFLLVEGIWGLFSPVVFGVLTTNRTHAAIHIVLGVIGLLIARHSSARNYLFAVGGLLAVVGVLYFLPGAAWLTVERLNVNFAVACLNIVLGVACVAVALANPRDELVVADGSFRGERG